MIRFLAAAVLACIAFTAHAHDVPYDRSEFGHSWTDDDKDGQNTRAEILIDQSTGPITFTSDTERTVATGRWISIFTKDVITKARSADIDHIVPLKWAWDRGAYAWTYEERKLFANDPRNLAIVEASLNRSKGARGPIGWLPPEEQCGYILRFTRMYKTYKLVLLQGEAEQYDTLREDVCS